MVLICDRSGKVGWVESQHVEVVSVDGKTPAEHLRGAEPEGS